MMKRYMLVAIAMAVVSALVATTPAAAWHPVGKITKKVQNVTAGGELRDANDADSAVIAKPGDTLKYVIEVRNDGQPDSRGWNDMVETTITDTLPDGVEPSVGNRKITAVLGLIKPKARMQREYTVSVTATEDSLLKNTACFTGDSAAHDNKQDGCDDAFVKVEVPEPVPTPNPAPNPAPQPTPAPVPAPVTTPQQPEVLPTTGPANIILVALVASAAGYLGYLKLGSRKFAKASVRSR